MPRPESDSDSDPPRSVYDNRTEEADLWFLPPDTQPDENPAATPRPGQISTPSEWLEAEATNGRALAQACAAFARLDERVRQTGAGAVRRLALMEAAELSWQAGDRVAIERLALHDLDRAPMAGDDAGALGAAHWAFRRLSGGPGPVGGLDDFLAREAMDTDPAVLAWKDHLAALDGALPLVRAACAFRGWRSAGLSAGVLEPAVIAARIGAAAARALPFMPLAQTPAPYFAGGSAASRVVTWARAAEAGALRALMTLDSLAAWQERALEATAHLSGRTPRLLIAALSASPALSAGMAANMTGASTAGARRNLGWFERAGLVREMTGQGRFRFWQAAL